MAQKKDEGLNGNEKIEQAVYQLQQEPTQEQLARLLLQFAEALHTGAAGAYPDRDPAADAGKRTGRGGGGAEPGQ